MMMMSQFAVVSAQLEYEDLVILMDALPEDQEGLDFTMQGGRELGPINVSSVTPGMIFDFCHHRLPVPLSCQTQSLLCL